MLQTPARELDPGCGGTSKPSYQEIFGWMAQQVRARNPASQRPLILLMDGQQSLWDAGLAHLPEETFQITEILDLLHACGYLWEAAHLFHPAGSAKALRFVRGRVQLRPLCKMRLMLVKVVRKVLDR